MITQPVDIKISDRMAEEIREAVRAGNTEFRVVASSNILRALHRRGLIDGAPLPARLTEDGKDVARQLKAHPQRRTFTFLRPNGK